MLNLPEILSIATVVLLAAIVWLLLRVSIALRPKSIASETNTELRTSRGVLPLSTISGLMRVPEVYVYSEAESTFRRIGLVDVHGKTTIDSSGGDGLNLVRGKLYRIVGRPQSVALKPERICISKGTTPGGAADWNIHDVRVGNRSQFSQSGVIPGDMFSASSIDSFVSFDTIQTAMDFSMDISYCGPNETEPFICAVIGTEARYEHS